MHVAKVTDRLRVRAVAIATRHLPRFVKSWVHRNRRLDVWARRAFRTLVGGHARGIEVQSGPLAGMFLAPSEHVSHAHISGAYEAATIVAIDRLVRPGSICYDLGASIGYVSLAMARRATHVYCFEPAPHAAAEIRKLMAANALTNYSVVSSPVSDEVKSVRFALTDVAYGSAIVRHETRWPALDLTSTTLDEFVLDHPAPDLVKIDVEGEEGRVLSGATAILDMRRTVFCVEIHSDEDLRQVREIFLARDYRMTGLDGGTVDWGSPVVAGEVHVIASPAEMTLPPGFVSKYAGA